MTEPTKLESALDELLPGTIADRAYAPNPGAPARSAIVRWKRPASGWLAEQNLEKRYLHKNGNTTHPRPALTIDIARSLHVSTEKLLSKPPRIDHLHDDPETKRPWKRFQRVITIPDRDQRAVI